MSDHSSQLDIPTTTHPCPAWCALTPGHGFESQAADGSLLRYHSRTVGTVQPGAQVDITAEETTDRTEDLALTVQPVISVYSDADELTAARARAVAGLLVEAARMLEEILRTGTVAR